MGPGRGRPPATHTSFVRLGLRRGDRDHRQLLFSNCFLGAELSRFESLRGPRDDTIRSVNTHGAPAQWGTFFPRDFPIIAFPISRDLPLVLIVGRADHDRRHYHCLALIPRRKRSALCAAAADAAAGREHGRGSSSCASNLPTKHRDRAAPALLYRGADFECMFDVCR